MLDMNKCIRVLGIETSCDETGVAIYDERLGLLVNQIYSQKKIHSVYGGVIPELAARYHIKKIVPLILNVLKNVGLKFQDISSIAYTAGPGLVGSLLVGATISKTIAYVWKIPSIKVHHMEAHLLMPMLENNHLIFPFLALLVSGGHTQLVYANDIGNYKILGETIDDSVGEVFDKIANLLGIKYPGGALLSKMARLGKSNYYNFPRPMINSPGLDFSFSGLKTAVVNVVHSLNIYDKNKYVDIARSFEDAIIDVLVTKCERALLQTGLTRLVISGGVSANDVLRFRLLEMLKKFKKGELFYSKKEFCTDNGAMIAYTGYIKLRNRFSYDSNQDLSILVKPQWSLEEL